MTSAYAPAVEFGDLQDAALREAWPHEALSFTPWLAENLHRLGREIGLELELDGVEMAVGPYAADILATNPRDGGRVLIENQLEEGDHRHLGQILTYLTGLDAKTVVWVAQRFRPEHLSAIRWLNEHTTEGFNFFAVRVRVVRIGQSPYAPLFEVVERPNDWDRKLQEAAREATDVSPVVASRRGFWARMAERHPGGGFTHGSASSQWYPIGATGLVVSAYIARKGFGVFLRGGRGTGGQAVLAALQPHVEALAAALEAPIGDPDYPFTTSFKADLNDPRSWDEAADTLLAETRRYADVVPRIVGEEKVV